MQVILLCIGFQSLLFSLCIQFSNGSFIELQQSSFVIGSSCLFIWLVLYFIMQPKPLQKQFASFLPIKKTSMTSNEQPSKSLNRYIQSPSKSINRSLLNASSNCNNKINNDENENENEIVYKRNDYLDWDEYFLSVASLSAMRSKDPSTQVGACIVNQQKRIVGIGYNGFPVGCSDDKLPWNRTSNKGQNDTKYPYVCHAEMNAILNKNSADCNQCTIYVSMFPCNECAKLIIQSGIKKIIFICDKYAKTDSIIASKRLLNMAGINYKQYIPNKKSILITFPQPN